VTEIVHQGWSQPFERRVDAIANRMLELGMNGETHAAIVLRDRSVIVERDEFVARMRRVAATGYDTPPPAGFFHVARVRYGVRVLAAELRTVVTPDGVTTPRAVETGSRSTAPTND
jgi:hypothetical protein